MTIPSDSYRNKCTAPTRTTFELIRPEIIASENLHPKFRTAIANTDHPLKALWDSCFPPDDKYLPLETKRMPDGKACQTLFIKDKVQPAFRSIHMDISWKKDVEPAVKSLSYVLTEPKKN